jgi:hypothetical protein
MRFAPYLIGLGLAVLTPLACGSSTGTTTAVVRPQLIAVDPRDFLGDIVCEPPPAPPPGAGGSGGSTPVAPRDPNAVHSYVATLFDVTPDADGGVPKFLVPLASSLPTTCAQQVTFSFVVGYRSYLAEIDAYHEEPSELFPISPGSRVLSLADGSRALPGWETAVCGGYAPSGTGGAGGTGGSGSSSVGGEAGAVDALGGSGGIAGTAGGPPGIISYGSITQTPHNCRPVLGPLPE